jgi:toxin ParE1/3/4
MKVRWFAKAISDLESIRGYIAQGSPVAARKVAARIKQATVRLASFPQSGRTGRVPGTRELVIPGTVYIAAYRIRGDQVEIAAVLHGRQN